MRGEDGGTPAGVDVIWASRETLPAVSLVEGIEMGLMLGGAMMLSHVTIAPGAVVPVHQHPNEQLGYVLEGIMALEIGGETRDLGPGACYLIPGGVPHGATSVDGCRVLDVFSPPRADYAELAGAAAPGGASPPLD